MLKSLSVIVFVLYFRILWVIKHIYSIITVFSDFFDQYFFYILYYLKTVIYLNSNFIIKINKKKFTLKKSEEN